jgi:hypothetical protein
MLTHLFDRLGVELLEGEGLHRHDVRAAVRVHEREPAAHEVLRESNVTRGGNSAQPIRVERVNPLLTKYYDSSRDEVGGTQHEYEHEYEHAASDPTHNRTD